MTPLGWVALALLIAAIAALCAIIALLMAVIRSLTDSARKALDETEKALKALHDMERARLKTMPREMSRSLQQALLNTRK